jgi:phospholipid/cholesterol/gamma-HCH transport system substrate-binding protein
MAIANTNRWKLGLFVVVGVVVAVGSLMWLGITELQQRTTPVYFYFSESVNGLEVGAPVEYLGVELGRVEAISPALDRVHIEVQAGIYLNTLTAWGIAIPESGEDQGELFSNLRGQLVRSALTSVAFIELRQADVDKDLVQEFSFATPPRLIYTTPSTFVSLEKGLTEALDQWPEIAGNAARVLEKMDGALGAMDFPEYNRSGLEALAAAEQLMEGIASSPILNAESDTMQSFSVTLGEFRALIDQLRGPDGDVNRAVTSFVGAADAIEEDFGESDIPGTVAALERAGVGFEGTSQEMNAVLRDLRQSLQQLDATLGAVQSMATLLSRDPSSVLHGRTPQQPFNPK